MKPMGALVVFVVSAILLVHPLMGFRIPAMKMDSKVITQDFIRPSVQVEKVELDMCKTCTDAAGEVVQDLLNIILQGGVLGGCAEICKELASKTTPYIGDACKLICVYEGVEKFIDIIKRADLDPLYYCELINICPINDHGDAKFTSIIVAPKSGPQGMFAISANYVSKNGTGPGQFSLEIDTVDHIKIGENMYNAMAPAGYYKAIFQLNAVPDPDCDPSQGDCEQWLPGNYTMKISICNGECGSKHPHSAIYDTVTTNFTITK